MQLQPLYCPAFYLKLGSRLAAEDASRFCCETFELQLTHTSHSRFIWDLGVEGANVALQDVLQKLQRSNQEYEARFEHVFLICASGLSAAQMLQQLQTR